MASYRDTVKLGLLQYSSIFPTPFDVAHHMFMVIGNGYHWSGGELVDGSSIFPIDEAAVVSAQREKLAGRIEATRARFPGADLTLDSERELVNYEFTAANIERALDYSRPPHDCRFYPCSPEFAKILTFPDDARTDWLWAMHAFIDDCEQILRGKASGAELSEADKAWEAALPEAKERIEHLLLDRGEMSPEADALAPESV